MTREDIIRMAQEAGFDYSGAELSWESVICTEELERFAALVASAERQACIDLLMGLHEAQSNNGNHNYYHYAANAIKELRKQA